MPRCLGPCFTCDFYELRDKHQKQLLRLNSEEARQKYMADILITLVNEVANMIAQPAAIKPNSLDLNKLHYTMDKETVQ